VSSGQTGDAQAGGPEGSMSEEELRAAYEAEIKKIRIEQVLLEQIVSLVNLGMRRTGLQPGTEDERDLGQVRLAIESIRVQLPLVEQIAAPEAAQIRDALSQLQLAFVRLGGSAPAEGVSGGETGPGQGPAAGAASGAPEPQPQAPGGTAPINPVPGGPAPGGRPAEPGAPGDAGPAQRSGRLWIPGQ
jgi:hypothetical protein